MALPRGTIEASLVAAGTHPLSAFWERQDIRARVIVARVGRRGGKSTRALRWMLEQIFERDWRIDPADTGIVAIVSARRWQAVDRIATMREYIRMLESYWDTKIEIGRPAMDRIDLEWEWGKCSIRAFVASKAGVVSATMIGAVLDEVAQWRDDTGANPASHVISSLKPSLLSTGGSMWMISTPWGVDDAHAKAFEKGNTDGQQIIYAPTWDANPTLSGANPGGDPEEAKRITHELEPDELIWRREYAAIPMPGDSIHWMNAILLDRAIDNGRSDAACGDMQFGLGRIAAGGDLAFMRDSTALAVLEEHGDKIAVKHCAEWLPIDAPLEPSVTVTEALSLARKHGAERVVTDEHARALLIECARKVGVGYGYAPINGEHWAFARRALGDDRLILPSCTTHCACDGSGVCDRLVGQLRRVRVKIDGNRLRTVHDRAHGGHGDIAEAWATGAYQLRTADVGSTIAHGTKARFG